jgi:hypothetical protein
MISFNYPNSSLFTSLQVNDPDEHAENNIAKEL